MYRESIVIVEKLYVEFSAKTSVEKFPETKKNCLKIPTCMYVAVVIVVVWTRI